jgi:2-keto-4-pentenoate hydratase/2-oxohepta-3-ene-1,7-dioic acid hydratase in catechol pathway
MRFARILLDGEPTYARLEGDRAHPLARAPWLSLTEVGPARAWDAKALLCPVRPSKIICIGRNYAAHARELGNEPPKEPLMFLKPPSSLIGPNDAIVIPPTTLTEKIEHEAELGVVIGARGRNVEAADAMKLVFGYTCVGDITARDLQKKDGQWTRAKGFDTFCPTGPWLETDLDPATSRVTCRVNGTVRQDAPTRDMLFDVATLLSYASRVMTLEPGDLLVTGTPEGVGPLVAGDALEVDVLGVGILAVRVA